jgi:fibrillarin-like pre-rRNA processing protein
MSIESAGVPGLYTDGRSLYTRNLTPGLSVYGERLLGAEDAEYRAWNPMRSKLAALLLLRTDFFPFSEDSRVLYLGAGDGTTVSHVSDLCPAGAVFAVEISPVPFRKLFSLGEVRQNLFPILGDARRPEDYATLVGRADILYQDVAQRDQLEILLANLPFLRAGGSVFFMLKAGSVDVTAAPKAIAEETTRGLRRAGLEVAAVVDLGRRQKGHYAILCRR